MVTERNSNGEKTQATTPEDWFELHSRSVKNAKISHALITPGATIEQALIKSTIKDDAELNSLIFLLGYLESRNLTLHSTPPLDTIPRMTLRKLIGSSAIKGKARFEAAEVDIGIIDQSAHQSFITGKATPYTDLKTKRGFLRRDKDKEKTTTDE